MNPAKRKKLYRLELQKLNTEKQELKPVVQEEKVIQKEQVVVQEQIQVDSTLDLNLKLTDAVETTDTKKDKKKKLSSQDV